MAFLQVISYVAFWNIDGQVGTIQVNPSDTTSRSIGGQTSEEMHMLVDLLRNEKRLTLDTDTNLLSTD